MAILDEHPEHPETCSIKSLLQVKNLSKIILIVSFFLQDVTFLLESSSEKKKKPLQDVYISGADALFEYLHSFTDASHLFQLNSSTQSKTN